MSFQDFIEKNLNNDLSLDDRSNLDCRNFDFSPDKVEKIKEFDASVGIYKMLNQSQIEDLYNKMTYVSSTEQMDIKNDIFFGTRRLIHNYLISRSKYVQFREEPISMMIRDAEDILWNAINSYSITMGDFSTYVFKLFAQKTIIDLNNLNEKKEEKVSSGLHENISYILSKLKGKNIKLIKRAKFNNPSENLDYNNDFDEYMIKR